MTSRESGVLSLRDRTGDAPLVTWLLCTHRDGILLRRAVESCLSQTIENFELLLVVNGPNAHYLACTLADAYATDQRIRVIETPVYLLNFSLSFGLHLARAPFVARLDADDVAHPERLERQLAFMADHKDVAVLGSSYLLIDHEGHIQGRVDLPTTDASIRAAMYFRNPICHPTVMLRREAVLEIGAYLGGRNAEDYDLWLRLTTESAWRFANLSEPLVSYNGVSDGEARRSRTAYANVAAAQVRQFLVSRDVRWLIGAFLSGTKSILFAERL